MGISQSDDKMLIWKDEYSVKVKEIDNQHRQLFEIINGLVECINKIPNEAMVEEIVSKLVEYKRVHFETEEKYFHQFNYEGTNAHEAQHREFNQKVKEIQEKHQGSVITFAFELVDFLEDWLIYHLMNMDQKYVKCFNDNGLF
jgi:hemerythrin